MSTYLSKIDKFPLFLKNPVTDEYIALWSAEKWSSLKKIGSRRIYFEHKCTQYSDMLYLRDLIQSGWRTISEEEWQAAAMGAIRDKL